MARIALWLALAALAAVPVRAAEETAESATTQALAHAARAKVHYDLGEYERAAEEYILVYRIKPRPGTLFNIAQSYRKAGQYGKAKQFYESYLRETPETKNRAVVEKAIKEIDGLLAKEKRAKDGPPQGVAQDRGLAPPPATAATVTPPTTTAAVTPPALPSATHPADKLALPLADRGLALPPTTTMAGTQPPLPSLPPAAAQKASSPAAASAQPAASTGSPSTASPVAAQSSQATVAAAAIPAKGTAPVTAAPNATGG